jgi:hypothetical protein
MRGRALALADPRDSGSPFPAEAPRYWQQYALLPALSESDKCLRTLLFNIKLTDDKICVLHHD